ncbi:MAG: RraA family protein [Thermoleophilia bacterium]|nr:RraA family protein [Thermoleophilia bacterium]
MDLDVALALTATVTSASICDAMARRYSHRAHITGLIPTHPGTATAGIAATIRMAPRRDDMPSPDLIDAAARALADIPAGAVLVIAGPDAPGEAVAGGRKLAALEELGAAGVIAWGRIRDASEVSEYAMGVWSLGGTPRGSGDLLQVIEVGGPVAFGGITIQHGDWVHVDDDGLVTVPAGDRDEILRAAVEIEVAGAAAVRAIRATGRTPRS